MSLCHVTKSGLSILLHGILSLPDTMSCDKTKFQTDLADEILWLVAFVTSDDLKALACPHCLKFSTGYLADIKMEVN